MSILPVNCLRSNTFNGLLNRSRTWTTTILLFGLLLISLYLFDALSTKPNTALLKPLYGHPRITIKSTSPPPLSQHAFTPPTNQTKLLIPLTSPSKPFCQSMYTAILSSYTPIIIHLARRKAIGSFSFKLQVNPFADRGGGWQVSLPKFWERWYKVKTDKTGTVSDFLEGVVSGEAAEGLEGIVGDDEVVVVADGLDIWYQLPAEEMIKRFHALNKDLVIAAERNCHPPTTKFMCDAYGERLEGKDVLDESGNVISRAALPQFANTGLLLGTPHQLAPLYSSMLLSQQSNLFNMPDDQGLAHVELYRYPTGQTDEALGEIRMGLDHGSELVFNLAHSEGDLRVEEIGNGEVGLMVDGLVRNVTSDLVRIGEPARYIRNGQTGEIPAAVHFSSKELKRRFSHDWAEQWFSAGGYLNTGNDADSKEGAMEIDLEAVRERVRQGMMWFVEERRWRSWQDVCGEFELS